MNPARKPRFPDDEPGWMGRAPTGHSPAGAGIVRYAVRVTWKNGEDEFLKEGRSPSGPVAIFASRQRAEEMRTFMLAGMADEVQGIDVVLAPLARGAA